MLSLVILCVTDYHPLARSLIDKLRLQGVQPVILSPQVLWHTRHPLALYDQGHRLLQINEHRYPIDDIQVIYLDTPPQQLLPPEHDNNYLRCSWMAFWVGLLNLTPNLLPFQGGAYGLFNEHCAEHVGDDHDHVLCWVKHQYVTYPSSATVPHHVLQACQQLMDRQRWTIATCYWQRHDTWRLKHAEPRLPTHHSTEALVQALANLLLSNAGSTKREKPHVPIYYPQKTPSQSAPPFIPEVLRPVIPGASLTDDQTTIKDSG